MITPTGTAGRRRHQPAPGGARSELRRCDRRSPSSRSPFLVRPLRSITRPRGHLFREPYSPYGHGHLAKRLSMLSRGWSLRSLAVSGKGESEDRAAGLASDECSDNPDRADLTDGAIGRKLVPFFGRQLALEGKCNIEYSYGSYLSSSEC